MRPSLMTQPVTISTPTAPTTDPVSGNEKPGTPETHQVLVYLAQRPPAELGSQADLRAAQFTVVSLWTMLAPPGTLLSPESTVTDSLGRVFRVVGEPANRPALRPQFKAAALRLVSDMGGAA